MFFRPLTSPYDLTASAAEGNGAGGGAADDDDQDDGDDEGAAGDDVVELTAERYEAARREAREAKAEAERLKKHRDTVMAERKKLSSSLKRWNSLGDPDEIEQRLAEREKEDEEQAHKTGDTEKLLAQRDERYKRDMTARDETIADLKGKIERLTINQRLRNALADVKVDTDLMDGAFALLRPKMRLVEDDGGEDGYSVVAAVDNDELSIEDYVRSLAETDPKFQRYLVMPVNSGGGAAGGRRGGDGPIVRKPRDKMDLQEKNAFIAKHGMEKYLALPETSSRA